MPSPMGKALAHPLPLCSYITRHMLHFKTTLGHPFHNGDMLTILIAHASFHDRYLRNSVFTQKVVKRTRTVRT